MNRNELDELFRSMRELPNYNKENLLCDLFAQMEGAQSVNGAYFPEDLFKPEDFFKKVQQEVDSANEVIR